MILGITIFALQNGMPLEVKFLFWGFKSSLVAVIFGSSLIGSVIVAFITVPLIVKKHIKEKNLTRRCSELEKKALEMERQNKEKDKN